MPKRKNAKQGEEERNDNSNKHAKADNSSKHVKSEPTTRRNEEVEDSEEDRSQERASWVLALHGGAAQGYFSEKGRKQYQKIMVEASRRAAELLKVGGSAVDAVKVAVEVMEDDATTNAGYGSNLTIDGTVECDASIMSGEDMAFGAVGAAPAIKNPIAAAAALLCFRHGLRFHLLFVARLAVARRSLHAAHSARARAQRDVRL